MKGDSQTTTQSQSSTTAPWSAAQPLLQKLIDSYGNLNTAVTPGQTAASNTLTEEAGAIPSLAPQATTAIQNLFGSSTAPQLGMLNQANMTAQGNLAPVASADLNPYSTPGFSDALNTMTSDITKNIKGVYSGAGRDPAGAGSFAGSLARGLTQGEAPVIASQYNANVANRLGANQAAYGMGSGTATTGAGLNQIPLTNALQALQNTGMLSNAFMAPGTAQLAAASTAQGLPFANLAQLLQPGISLGSLGTQSTGTGTSTTTQPQNMFSNIMGGALGGAGILSAMGGSGGGMAALAPLLALSDERAKDAIEPIGMLYDGQKVVRFRYKGEPKTQIGVIAQDVEKHEPRAVHEFGGLKMVDHKMATDHAAEMGRAA